VCSRYIKSYSTDAIKEATRDGYPPIDLIDGELLCDKLKEFKLGVETELIESVEVKVLEGIKMIKLEYSLLIEATEKSAS